MDRTKYTGKCSELLQTNQFMKLYHDPTKSIERKIQPILRKLKNRLSAKEYYQLYSTGLYSRKFYGTAKIHSYHRMYLKIIYPWDRPLKPIVSNIGTASYQLTKCLAKLLSPLAQSNYIINSTKGPIWCKISFYFGSIRTHHWHNYKENLWKTWNNNSIYKKWNQETLNNMYKKRAFQFQ